MNLIKVGCRWMNLRYMIIAEEKGHEEIVVVMETGRAFALTGPDAARFRETVDEFVAMKTGAEPSSAQHVHIQVSKVIRSDGGRAGDVGGRKTS